MHGIVLRKTRVKESDFVVNWLTDEDRLIAAYAGHIHRYLQSFPNGLELMTIYELELGWRNQAMARTKSAYNIEQFDTIVHHEVANVCACAALEAISDICPEDSIVIDLFSTLLQTFAVMNTAPELSPMILAWFESFLLHQLGALPNLDMCAQCARPLIRSSYYQEEFGFICDNCAQGNQNIPGFVLEAVRRLRFQDIRTTVQNALQKNNETQMKRVIAPVIKFLVSVIANNSPIKKLSAHRYMVDVALGMPDLLD